MNKKFKSLSFVMVFMFVMSVVSVGSLSVLAAAPATSTETLTLTDEGMTYNSTVTDMAAYHSPITTYKNNIYTVYLDDKLNLMIAKKDSKGNKTTHLIFPACKDDQFNVAPSIGIDKNGYIHVVGNMNVSPKGNTDTKNPYRAYAWQYWVSNKAENITSFTFKGDGQQSPPGFQISYPKFTTDRKGELYLSFRHMLVKDFKSVNGEVAGGVAKYNATTKKWTMLGGTNDTYKTKTLFWTNKPIGDSYEPATMDLFFDANNRMHLAYTMQDHGKGTLYGYGGTEIAYAYSDDGGNTFYRANGTKYAKLPITLANADLVVSKAFAAQLGEGSMINSSSIACGVGSDKKPIVTFSRKDDVWDTSVHALKGKATGDVTMEYDLTPLRSKIDAGISYSDSSKIIDDFGKFSIIVRANTDGFFDARNAGNYVADAQVPYTPNTTYHFKIVASLSKSTYSVWVTPPGASPILLADNYAFRSDSPVMTDVGQCTTWGVDGTYKVQNNTVSTATGITDKALDTWFSEQKGATSYFVKWNGTKWTTPAKIPLTPVSPTFMSAKDGKLTGWNDGNLIRSFDDGVTWQGYSAETGIAPNCVFDRRYAYDTNQFRYQALVYDSATKTYKIKVFTAKFSTVKVAPTPEPVN